MISGVDNQMVVTKKKSDVKKPEPKKTDGKKVEPKKAPANKPDVTPSKK
jgi:hypothetical protein